MKKWSVDTQLSEQDKRKKIKLYTSPKKNFDYQMISWDQYIRNEIDGYMVRSSIIPVTSIRGRTYWLLGSFHDYPREIVADFGGNCFIKEGSAATETPFGCAIRELNEESKGLLTQVILKNIGLLDSKSFHIYLGKFRKQRVVFFFVPFVMGEVENIIKQFNEMPDIDEKLGPLDLYLEMDIFDQKYLTSNYLTDFVNFLKK